MVKLACGLYDQLEVFAMRGMNVDITYFDFDGNEKNEKGIINDTITKDGKEFIIFNNTKQINILDIIKINGIIFRKVEL